MVITSIRDNVRGICLEPKMRENEKTAIREFMSMLNEAFDSKTGLLYFYPGDFDLWYLGEFDEHNISFSDLDNARILYRGATYINLVSNKEDDDVAKD